MKQFLTTVSALCMAAALCEQLTRQSRFFPAIRLALGLKIAAVAVTAVCAGLSIRFFRWE